MARKSVGRGQESGRKSGDGLWGGGRCARLRFAGRAVSSAGLINARGGKNETFTGPLIFHRSEGEERGSSSNNTVGRGSYARGRRGKMGKILGEILVNFPLTT